jgi:GR25 family glycosyltransferase involved in LPS biosynthesis
MIFNSIFNHIYVLNLKESIDRREHIEKEFKRVNITNYNFFEATPYYSDEVKDLMKSDFVKKFPNCFRCDKKRCSCENNYLTPFQIANWCSFLNIFKDIIQNDYQFVLICEDDIVFTFQYKRIIDKLLSSYTFKQYNIDMKKPLLIRLGTAYNPYNHNSRDEAMFIKNFSLCNPCFAINKSMAIVYLYYLKIIDYHSDIYFHNKIPKNIKGVQYFTMYPYPVYELSFVKEKQKFESLVRPKNHFRRMEYIDFLILVSNPILELFIKNLVKKMNLLEGVNIMMNHYLFLNELEKSRFYFEKKIILMDNEENDIKIISENTDFYKKYSKLIDKPNEVESVDSYKLFYKELLKIFEMDKIEKINIHTDLDKFIRILKNNK